MCPWALSCFFFLGQFIHEETLIPLAACSSTKPISMILLKKGCALIADSLFCIWFHICCSGWGGENFSLTFSTDFISALCKMLQKILKLKILKVYENVLSRQITLLQLYA